MSPSAPFLSLYKQKTRKRAEREREVRSPET